MEMRADTAAEYCDEPSVEAIKGKVKRKINSEPTRGPGILRDLDRLRARGLSPRRKLLLIGPPGSGKTMTAAALAGELKLPIFTVLYDGLIGKLLGETASRLRLVFDAIAIQRGIYFFDEFDAIGKSRDDV